MSSKISGATGALVSEAVELKIWLLCFRCASEEFRVIVANLDAMDKCPVVYLVGIGETLHQDIAKLVMRAVGDQADVAYRILQLCAGLEAGI